MSRGDLAFFGGRATLPAVPKCRSETLDDLLADVVAAGRLTEFARTAGLSPWTLLRLRNGESGRTHRGTVLALAWALGIEVARVRAAIEASRESE